MERIKFFFNFEWSTILEASEELLINLELSNLIQYLIWFCGFWYRSHKIIRTKLCKSKDLSSAWITLNYIQFCALIYFVTKQHLTFGIFRENVLIFLKESNFTCWSYVTEFSQQLSVLFTLFWDLTYLATPLSVIFTSWLTDVKYPY